MMPNVETFRIESIEEATRFDELICQYSAQIFRSPSGTDDSPTDKLISTLFLFCQDHHYYENRLFHAFVDLKITYMFMFKDATQTGGIWNSQFSPEHSKVESVLVDVRTFSGKMNILYGLTSFALRCRAFWDKYLGVLFLLYDKERYDSFLSARSRKKKFKTLAKEWTEFSPRLEECLAKCLGDVAVASKYLEESNLQRSDLPNRVPFPDPFIECLVRLIEALDEIRTQEAHGPGVLRKWSLSMLPLDKSRDFGLMNHWNIANEFMKGIEDVLGSIVTNSIDAVL